MILYCIIGICFHYVMLYVHLICNILLSYIYQLVCDSLCHIIVYFVLLYCILLYHMLLYYGLS